VSWMAETKTGLLELASVDLGGWDILPGCEFIDGACGLPRLYWIRERAWYIGLAESTLLQRERLRAARDEGRPDRQCHCYTNRLHGATLSHCWRVR
jgi:hypothetical protein